MNATIQSILNRVMHVTKDYDMVRWTLPELILWLNDAQGQIAQMHPRAAADQIILTLKEGSRQDLRLIDPTVQWVRLHELQFNITNNEPAGKAVRQIVSYSLDRGVPDWRGRAATAREVVEYALDERVPYLFDVNPPVREGVQVMAMVTVKPAPIGALTTDGTALLDPDERFGLAHGYDIAATDYILFRCFSKDANDPSYQNRANGHLQAFQLAMGVETADAASG